MKVALKALFAVSIFSTVLVAEDDHAPAEDLTPKLRHFLQKEMHALVKEGRAVEKALDAGNSAAVRKHAGRMHEAFIFQDDITTFDLRVLKATLGEDFVERDKAFHAMAHELEETEELELQDTLFNKMLGVCSACHKAYAPDAGLLE